MSGAAVFRCDSRSGHRFALKRWPSAAKRTRIDEVHRVIAWSRHAGCGLVPQLFSIHGNATVTAAGGYWELCQWMPGEPVSQRFSIQDAESGAAAIARFHAAARPLGCQSQPPPAVIARLKRTEELQSILPAALATDPFGRLPSRLANAVAHAQRVLRNHWTAIAAEMTRKLSRAAESSVTTQYVLRDVHRSHILFQGEKASGLIDFDAIRVDTPATDLARWTGSLLALATANKQPQATDPKTPEIDAESLWNAVLAGFLRESSLKNQQEAEELIESARILHHATTWASLGNWVVWLVIDDRSFPAGEDVVVQRILEWTGLAEECV